MIYPQSLVLYLALSRRAINMYSLAGWQGGRTNHEKTKKMFKWIFIGTGEEGDFFKRPRKIKKKYGGSLWLPIKQVLPSTVVRVVVGNMAARDYVSRPPVLLGVSHITTFLTNAMWCVCKKKTQPRILSPLILPMNWKTGEPTVFFQQCTGHSGVMRRQTLAPRMPRWGTAPQHYLALDLLHRRNKHLSSEAMIRLGFLDTELGHYVDKFLKKLSRLKYTNI